MSGKKVILFILVFATVVSGFAAWQALKIRRQLGAAARTAADLPVVRRTETGEMRLVPYGSFNADEDRIPVTLPVFYIDRTEVSNGNYARFTRERGKAVPTAEADLPVVNVTYEDAKAFCEWAGKRLPMPVEWEKAARGMDGRTFPWGDTADASKANVAGQGLRPVESTPEGASPFGVLNMAGNVWEWVDDPRKPMPRNLEILKTRIDPAPSPDEPWFAARGGAFDHPLTDARVYTYLPLPARYRAADLGFRCAVTPVLR